MIRIGCCTGVKELAPADMGFDYLELPLAQVMELSGKEFGELAAGIRAGAAPVEVCNVFFPGHFRLTGDDARPGEALEYAKAAAERAAALGAGIIVLGSGGARKIPPGFPHERGWEQFGKLLGEIGGILKPLGITVVLEPLNTGECNLITTAAGGLKMVRSLGLENVKLLIDYYHMRLEGEDPGIVREAGALLRHTHIAAKEGRLFPRPGDGENYGEFFSALKASGYEGRVSVEGRTKDLALDGPAALRLLRSLAA